MGGETTRDVTPDDSSKIESSESGTAMATRPAPKRAPSRKEPGQLPPFRVLLHNDDVNTFEHVVHSIIKLTPLSQNEAATRTLEAHERGVALLLVTHKERAELYGEQFASLSLTVTIEPDS
jgi:ATP-dependent Clp protease adaptor protein ClpS